MAQSEFGGGKIETMLFHFVAKCVPADPQRPSRFRLIAVCSRQRLSNEPFLVIFKTAVAADRGGRDGEGGARKTEVVREILNVDRIPQSHHAAVSNHIFKFPNVTRPVVPRQYNL